MDANARPVPLSEQTVRELRDWFLGREGCTNIVDALTGDLAWAEAPAAPGPALMEMSPKAVEALWLLAMNMGMGVGPRVVEGFARRLEEALHEGLRAGTPATPPVPQPERRTVVCSKCKTRWDIQRIEPGKCGYCGGQMVESSEPALTLRRDGDLWCALLGENLQEGTAGFGATRSEALRALAEALESSAKPTSCTCAACVNVHLPHYLFTCRTCERNPARFVSPSGDHWRATEEAPPT